MGRSLKKGPFVDEHLMKKIEELNEVKQKASRSKHGHVVQRFFQRLSDIRLLYMMDANMFQFILVKIWSATNLVNLRQHAHYRGHGMMIK